MSVEYSLSDVLGKGGVIIKTTAPMDAIIAVSSSHSIWMGEHEYTVDWRRLSTITHIRYFPPCL